MNKLTCSKCSLNQLAGTAWLIVFFLPCNPFAATLINSSFGSGETSVTGNITLNSSIESFGGVNSVNTVTFRLGYPGQLTEAASIDVVDPVGNAVVDEDSALQLAAIIDNTDGTYYDASDQSTWQESSEHVVSVIDGQVETGAVVGQQTAIIVASAQGLNDSLTITIADTLLDNHTASGYAADGLDDAWQVANFGSNNPLAAPNVSNVINGQPNYFVYAMGFDIADYKGMSALNVNGTASDLSPRLVAFFERPETVPASITYSVVFSDDVEGMLNSEALVTPNTVSSPSNGIITATYEDPQMMVNGPRFVTVDVNFDAP